MAVPKRRTSKARKRKRRAHDALSSPTMNICPECGEPMQPHRMCPSCGSYKGRKIQETEEE